MIMNTNSQQIIDSPNNVGAIDSTKMLTQLL